MRWVEGMYDNWMEGGRLEGSAWRHVWSQRAVLSIRRQEVEKGGIWSYMKSYHFGMTDCIT